MDDLTTPTSDSTALAPAVGGDSLPADTSVSTTGVDQAAQAAFDQASTGTVATTDPIDAIITGIPENDDDLATEVDQARRDALVAQRTQLRTLGSAIRNLKPLEVFREFGDPAAVKPRLELARLLYSPLMRDGKPVRDAATQTTYITTKPFVEYLDKVSPGMPEQLYVDLNYFQPLGEDGVAKGEELWKQHFRYLKLDPSRLSEYQNIDALVARTSSAITPEELAEIPADYHAAYRSIPASIRSAWASFDDADKTRMLEDYKGKLDDVADKAARKQAEEQAKVAAGQAHAALVSTKQQEYFRTVRTARFTELYTSLEQQIKFSTDPAANGVLIGSLCTTLSNLLDPDWRFIAVERVLTPLGIKLPAGFDEVLEKFNSTAMEAVALRLAGDIGQSGQKFGDANAAVDQLIAKIAPIALAVAKKQGATVLEKAAVQADALAAAAAGRATVGSTTTTPQNTILPAGMNPDSMEATRYLMEKTGIGQRPAA